MIKLVASDMDGTLLNSEHEISNLNKKAIEKTLKNDIEFIVATGRGYFEAYPILEKNNIKCNVIAFNGGAIYDENKKLISRTPLGYENILFILDVFKQFDIDTEIYSEKTSYVKNIEVDVTAYIELIKGTGGTPNVEHLRNNAKEKVKKGFLTEIKNFNAIINLDDEPVIKMLGITTNSANLKKAENALKKNKNIFVTSSGYNNLEIMNKNANKGLALKKFAEHKNINLENVLALGDNLNDLSMIEIAKYSVAMKNGVEKIKNLAKYTSKKTNDESGVGVAILELLEKINNI